MKPERNHRNLVTLLTLAFAFTACSLGQARKDSSAPAGPGVNNANQSKKDQDASATGPGVSSKGQGAEEASADGQAILNPNSQACRLLPLSDLEAQFGGQAKVKTGIDFGRGESTCQLEVNGHVVFVQINRPEQFPFTIEQALAGARMFAEESKGGMTVDEVKNLGNVGCYSGKVDLLGVLKEKPPSMSLPGPSTVCFQVQGGLVIVTVANTENQKEKISFDVVKGLVEKAAARR